MFWKYVFHKKIKDRFSLEKAEEFANFVLNMKKIQFFLVMQVVSLQNLLLALSQITVIQKYGMNLNYITFNKIPEVIDNDKADYTDYSRAVLNKY